MLYNNYTPAESKFSRDLNFFIHNIGNWHMEPVKVALDVFEGPLDLLVYLVQRDEIEITDVPLYQIVDQYLKALKENINPCLDTGAEFIGTTAFLLWLKSRILLPKHEGEAPEEIDMSSSPLQILQHLIDYCCFKSAAKELSQREQKQTLVFSRGIEESAEPLPATLTLVPLDELAKLFQQVLTRAAVQNRVLHEELWRVSDKIHFLRVLLKESKNVLFRELFNEERCRDELIVTFLAILELMKQGEVYIIREEQTQSVMIIPYKKLPDQK